MSVKFTVDISTRLARLAILDTAALPPAVLEAIHRQSILERWGRAKGKTNAERATRRILGGLKRVGKPISRSTLYGWERAFERRGFVGLIDGRSDRHSDPMDETCRRLLESYMERLSPQALAMLTMVASFLATRPGPRKTKPQKAIETEIEEGSTPV
jgi:hypothetical protein